MHSLFNIKTGKTIEFPSDIDELTPEQYLFYIELALKFLSGELTDVQDLKRTLFVKLTNLKVSLKMHFYNQEVKDAVWSALAEKIDLLDSFFDVEENPDGRTIYKMHLDSGENLLPEWGGYRADAWPLDNITVGEFVSSIELMKQIRRLSQDETLENKKHIDECARELFFSLYRKKEKTVEIKKLPETVVFHVINYFGYFVELITTTPLVINGSEIDFSVLFPKADEEDEEPAPKNGDIGWNGVVFSVAETGVFGNVENVMKEKLVTILLFLYKRRRDAEEIEKRTKEKTP